MGFPSHLFLYYFYTSKQIQIQKYIKKRSLRQKKKDRGIYIYFECNNRIFGIMAGDENEPEKDVKTRFTDVLGIDEFKEELVELVDYLQNPDKY